MRTETKVLIEMRKSRDLTQKEMSLMFGWKTSQFVSNSERGLCGFPAESIKTVRKEFGDDWAEKIIKSKVKDFESQIRSASK